MLLATALAACCGASTWPPGVRQEPTGPSTLKVAFGSTYVFDTTALTHKWWKQVAKQFKAAHPKATVQFIPIPGSYNDIVNKLSLLYRTPSTAPDVAEIPTGQIGLWAQARIPAAPEHLPAEHVLVEPLPGGGPERGHVHR